MSIITILAIESSCDETAISVVKSYENTPKILSNIVSSQVKLHAKWGGVVPNLAAREHVKNFPKVLKMALEEARISPSQIDAIAITNGPGLIPALMVGVNLSKTLSYLWEKPLIGIHHIEGHIYANFVADTKLRNKSESTNINFSDVPFRSGLSDTKFPALVLIVSGGHTQLVLMKNHLKYEIIGQTVDDAVGEAFDKVARILGVGYPGGPNVAAWAAKFQNLNDKYQIKLPRPMINKPGFNFSFSGLKTAVLYEAKKNPTLLKDKKYIAEMCHEFQQACVDVLISKTLKAAEKYKPKTIMLAGGVSANKELREQLGQAIENYNLSNKSHLSYSIPDLSLTGDNAAMVGAAAAFRWQKMNETQKKKALSAWKTLQPNANLKMK